MQSEIPNFRMLHFTCISSRCAMKIIQLWPFNRRGSIRGQFAARIEQGGIIKPSPLVMRRVLLKTPEGASDREITTSLVIFSYCLLSWKARYLKIIVKIPNAVVKGTGILPRGCSLRRKQICIDFNHLMSSNSWEFELLRQYCDTSSFVA